jgi:hypothetical protein
LPTRDELKDLVKQASGTVIDERSRKRDEFEDRVELDGLPKGLVIKPASVIKPHILRGASRNDPFWNSGGDRRNAVHACDAPFRLTCLVA